MLTINTETKKLLNGDKELIDVSASPNSSEAKGLSGPTLVHTQWLVKSFKHFFAAETLGVQPPSVFAKSKEVSHSGQD